MTDTTSRTDYTTRFTVDRSPAEVFAAVNDVRSWWTGEVDGPTAALGDEFTYRHQDLHRSTQRVTESVPGRRVVWLVTDAHLSFAADPGEWTGTQVTFDLVPVPGGTEVRFTHVGLSPADDCYASCSSAWDWFVGDRLRHRVTDG